MLHRDFIMIQIEELGKILAQFFLIVTQAKAHEQIWV